MSFDDNPRSTEDHDLLVIPKLGELQRVLVAKRPWEDGRPQGPGGTYVGLEPVSAPEEPGNRKALSVARPEGDRLSGPAFAAMPVKPEPASSFYTCFLVNGDNVRFQNDWTAAEWNDFPGAADAEQPNWRPVDFEMLIGAQQGVVFHLTVSGGKHQLERVQNLGNEAEIWTQLRAGVVAGRVRYLGHPRNPGAILPLVNVTALQL